jgi:CzcA family heavy metal efflux pump
MSFYAWAHSHVRSILFLMAVLSIGGLVSGWGLPVALFPEVSFPRIRVDVEAGDRPAERMALEVTYPIEQALRAVPGVRSLRSTSSRGSADISVNFDWGQDMIAAMLQAESQIARLIPSLPSGTSFEVKRMDPTVFPVIAYSLTSSTHSLGELRDLATYDLRPLLSTISGVANVDVQGGAVEEYRVEVNPVKLQSLGMTLSDVATNISAANVLTAVGRVEDFGKLYLVISDTRFASADQISQTVLRSGANGVVRLEDVATVRKDTAPNFTRVTADGHNAVLFQVYQQPGGNTVQIAREVKAKLEQARQRLPADIRMASWYDQSDLILASAGSVRDAVLIGVGLSAVVLLLFLRNWKVTLIATLAVPAALASTVLLLYVLHMSFNIMTLGGMAAAVGLIIDDAIVMVEQITRRLRGGSGPESERVMRATAEFTRPLIGSSASTIIIFTPLAFLSGVTGAFFKALSLTMALSLVISFLIAWLAIPVIAAHLLGPKDAGQEEGGRLMRLAQRRYARLMHPLLARPGLIALVIIPTVCLGYLAYRNLASGFMPVMDEGGFIIDYNARPGTSLTETDRLLRQVEGILRATPEVQTYSRRTGLQLGGGLTEANSGDLFVRLKPLPRRPLEAVMNDVRQRVEHVVPGLQIETAQLMEDLIGDLTAVPQPIEVIIFSDNPGTLETTARAVAEGIRTVDGVEEVKSGIVLAGDALEIKVDRVRAALEGMDPDAITRLLNDLLTGNVTTQIPRGPKLVGVRVWTARDLRATVPDLKELLLRAPDGHLFPLKRVALLRTVTGQPEITRDDLKRMVAVTARISGRDLGSTIRDVQAVLQRPGLIPAGVTYRLGGLYEQQRIAFRGLLVVIIAAIALVFLLLLFLYESLRVATAMLLTTMLVQAAVFMGLWLTNTELNITSIMGMTMIVGIATEVAIFYYSEYAGLPDEQAARRRLIAAGVNRMRAITMTTLAAILALLPLALGLGQGAAMQQPLAIAIIAGLIAQLPMVLIILPAVLRLLHSRGERSNV